MEKNKKIGLIVSFVLIFFILVTFIFLNNFNQQDTQTENITGQFILNNPFSCGNGICTEAKNNPQSPFYCPQDCGNTTPMDYSIIFEGGEGCPSDDPNCCPSGQTMCNGVCCDGECGPEVPACCNLFGDGQECSLACDGGPLVCNPIPQCSTAADCDECDDDAEDGDVKFECSGLDGEWYEFNDCEWEKIDEQRCHPDCAGASGGDTDFACEGSTGVFYVFNDGPHACAWFIDYTVECSSDCMDSGVDYPECDDCPQGYDCLGVCGGGAELGTHNYCAFGACTSSSLMCNPPEDSCFNDDACYCPSEVYDCLGVCNGSAEIDVCGVCGGDETDPDECDDCSEGYDVCGVCGGDETDPDECDDSNGVDVPPISEGYDVCGVCGGDETDPDECDDSNGVDVPPIQNFYRACNINQQCVLVAGEGESNCFTGNDCFTTDPNPPTYNTCSLSMQCVKIIGLRPNTCNISVDCVPDGFNPINPPPKRTPGSFNNIISFDAKYNPKTGLEITLTCLVDDQGVLTIPIVNITEPGIGCSKDGFTTILPIYFLENGLYELTFEIDRPCSTCNMSTFVNIKESAQSIAINEFNLISVILVLSLTILLIKKK